MAVTLGAHDAQMLYLLLSERAIVHTSKNLFVPAPKSSGVSFPFQELIASRVTAISEVEKNSESLTIGRVKRLWTADDSSICRIDICGDPDSSL